MDDFDIPEELIESILGGNCVAFVGAGFSIPCNLPSWAKLLNLIVDDIDPSKSSDNVNNMDRSIDAELISFLRTTIETADETKNAELYDLVGQMLEDHLGTKAVEELVDKQLKIPTEIPEEMKKRLHFLNTIPFKAILTTNFDLLLDGPTPWSKDKQDYFPYEQVLRQPINASKYRFSVDELVEEHLSEDIRRNNNENIDELATNSIVTNSFTVSTKLTRPIIKLHGSLGLKDLERSLVWTRTGYRKLIHQTPGYANFLRSILSTSTVLYIGFSFSDGYLNELRGEVLSMLYGPNDINESLKVQSPIGYAIVNDKNKHEIDFFKRHEGVQILTWNTNVVDLITNQPKKDFTGFDKYLAKIHEKTSFSYYIGKITCDKKILVLEYDYITNRSSNLSEEPIGHSNSSLGTGTDDTESHKPPLLRSPGKLITGACKLHSNDSKLSERPRGFSNSSLETGTDDTESYKSPLLRSPGNLFRWDSEGIETFKDNISPQKEFNYKRMGDLVPLLSGAVDRYKSYLNFYSDNDPVFDIVYSVKDAIAKLQSVCDSEFAKRYDAIVTVFGEDRTKSGNHWWKQLVDEMRQLPAKSQTPFIVYSSNYNEVNRRKFCLSHGAYEFVSSFPDLVEALTNLIKKTEKKPSSPKSKMKEETYEY